MSKWLKPSTYFGVFFGAEGGGVTTGYATISLAAGGTLSNGSSALVGQAVVTVAATGTLEAVALSQPVPGVAVPRMGRPKTKPITVGSPLEVAVKAVVTITTELPHAAVSVRSRLDVRMGGSISLNVVDIDLLNIAIALED